MEKELSWKWLVRKPQKEEQPEDLMQKINATIVIESVIGPLNVEDQEEEEEKMEEEVNQIDDPRVKNR